MPLNPKSPHPEPAASGAPASPLPSRRPLRAATLAVGTEVTDGQIIDRNSGWISQMLIQSGIQVIEHRAVADERGDIRRALEELAARVDLLFVTGGLGPTSDDFTRVVIAEVFGQTLEFDEKSWSHLETMLQIRGVAVRDIQRQQCFFPKGARILTNPAGTANGFMFETSRGAQKLKLYALPGPPAEIAAIWELNLQAEISSWIKPEDREILFILSCLGRPESEVAEKTEAAIAGSGIRVGYRAHLPYVEVKLWVPGVLKQELATVVQKVEDSLGDWVVARGKEDLAETFLRSMQKIKARTGRVVQVRDLVTAGWLQERLVEQIRKSKLQDDAVPVSLETVFGADVRSELASSTTESAVEAAARSTTGTSAATVLTFEFLDVKAGWKIRLQGFGEFDSELELIPPKHYNLGSERARKYATEMFFLKMKFHLT